MIIYLKREAALAGSLWEAGTRLEIPDPLGAKAIADGIASADPAPASKPEPASDKEPEPKKKRGRPKKPD